MLFVGFQLALSLIVTAATTLQTSIIPAKQRAKPVQTQCNQLRNSAATLFARRFTLFGREVETEVPSASTTEIGLKGGGSVAVVNSVTSSPEM